MVSRPWNLLFVCLLLIALVSCAGAPKRYGRAKFPQYGIATWYGRKHHGRHTASGERFNMYAMTAAHPFLPFGSRVKVTNLNNDRHVRVRINDRGPSSRGRIIDVSYQAARKLGFVRQGLTRVRVDLESLPR